MDAAAAVAAALATLPRNTDLRVSDTILDTRVDSVTDSATDASDEAGGGDDFSLLEVIGRGGRGVVHRAHQNSLGRDVAVKFPLEGLGDEASEELVREARIAGRLEHPNIVPIHMLSRAEGLPSIVMKCLDGRPWGDLLEEDTPLDTHLEILDQVCHAVSFAHARGVVHRDLKPDNVVVGRFGEVCVVDWGIAIDLEDRDHATGVAGTPIYMAPEMVREDATQITERTDIYLLGGILHHIVTGSPPHPGDSLSAVMVHALRSLPPDLDDVPQLLASVCRRALAANPDDRFDSAEAFRLALAAHRTHRESIALADEASERLEQISVALAGDTSALESRHQLEALFAEARFAARRALSTWAQNDAATRTLRACVVTMAEYALGRRDGERAALLIAELDAPPPALTEALAALHAELAVGEAELVGLRELKKDMDRRPLARSFAVFLPFVVLPVLGVGLWLSRSAEVVTTFTHLQNTSLLVGLMLTAGIVAIRFRKIVLVNQLARRTLILTAAAEFIMVIHSVADWVRGAAVYTTITDEAILISLACVGIAVLADLRFLVPALAYVLAFMAMAGWPELRYVPMVAAHTAMILVGTWIWRTTRAEP